MDANEEFRRNWHIAVGQAELARVNAGHFRTEEERRAWERSVPKNPTRAQALSWQISEARAVALKLPVMHGGTRATGASVASGHKRATKPRFTARQIEIAQAALAKRNKGAVE